jgi:phospholipid/cholesterol/gamma-HCH transport system permease protein
MTAAPVREMAGMLWSMSTEAPAITRVGGAMIGGVTDFGRFVRFAGATASWFLLHPRRWVRWHLLAPQLYAVGVATIPVVAVTGAFIGMVLALESYQQFEAVGQGSKLGGLINIAVIKQIGPVLAAVMVAGRVGCALAAELGTMRVTEQLDALRSMASDPILHLVVPRVLACILMTPALTVYSDLLGIWGGWLITVQIHGVPPHAFWDFSAYYINWWEPTSGLLKSVVFGGAIGLISCYKGFHCRPGAAGVGRAAMEAFVASFLAIIVLNLFLAKLLNDIGILFIQPAPVSPLG